MPTYGKIYQHMANTRKGLKTQDTILQTAKHLFYLYGFDKVSLNDICIQSSKKLGTLTYYFPKKWDIVDALYQQYMSKIRQFVTENCADLSPAQQYVNTVVAYYYNIYKDSAITRFHHHIMLASSMNDIFADTKQLVLPLVVEDIDDDLLDLYIQADNAVRRELNLAFMRDTKRRSLSNIVDLVRRIHLVSTRLYGFDPETLKVYIADAQRFVESHPNSIHLIEI